MRWWRSSIDERMPPEDRSGDEPVEHLLVGEIASAHGLGGEVSVKVLSEDEGRFARGSVLLVGRNPVRARPMEVERSRSHSGRTLVKFAHVGDRTTAESLRGLLAFVPAGEAADLEGGAFWEHELKGAKVLDVAGVELGILTAVEERLEQDLWDVQTPGGVVLLPAAKGIIVSVDLESKQIVVDPPSGLFPDSGSTGAARASSGEAEGLP